LVVSRNYHPGRGCRSQESDVQAPGLDGSMLSFLKYAGLIVAAMSWIWGTTSDLTPMVKGTECSLMY